MSGHVGRYTNTVPDLVGAFTDGERADMEGPIPGRIVAFSADGKSATVRPTVSKRTWDDQPLPYPDLPDVPVSYPLSANGGMVVPLRVGDDVELTPMGRSTEAFHSGEEGGLGRSFDLSDMVARPSSGSLTNALENFDPENAHMRFGRDGRFGIKGSPDGKVRIDGAEGDAYAILAAAVRLLAGAQTIVSGGSSAGSYDHDQKAAVLALADKLDAMSLA